jgi:hypothetical protein
MERDLSFLTGGPLWERLQEWLCEVQNLVARASFVSGRLMLRQQDARERPILCVHADRGGDSSGSLGNLAGPFDFAGEHHSQICVQRNVQFLLGGEAGVVSIPFPGVQCEPGLNLGLPKASVTG